MLNQSLINFQRGNQVDTFSNSIGCGLRYYLGYSRWIKYLTITIILLFSTITINAQSKDTTKVTMYLYDTKTEKTFWLEGLKVSNGEFEYYLTKEKIRIPDRWIVWMEK